ncbi:MULTISPECIES: isochorismatase family protein [Photobacterium]|uniref:Hydrolase n=1 Tax=Photobacterium halotolerans TaxID=265726 RepID=A0A0F5VII2_9GAMM|nr:MULTISPECIES: isochorismatase family protein [Photobacterium]KKD01632.1 hydrolase [Photobacterium halotolerans]UIP27404.1 isochorismatase family protein [Photobacterium sp. TLY01]
MPLTQLDSRTALIVIDLQKGIVGLPLAHDAGAVVKQAARLAEAFRHHQLPVVLVNVAGGSPGRTEQARSGGEPASDWTELVSAMSPQADDICITKRSWGAFSHTDLAERLDALSVTQVVVVGIATSIGVESTARQAYEIGLNVTLCTDAMTDMNVYAHHNSLERIFPRLGETGTTEALLALLAER